MYSVCSQTAQPSHEALHEAAAGGGERAPDGVRAGGAELGPAQPHLPAGPGRGWRGCWPHLPARAGVKDLIEVARAGGGNNIPVRSNERNGFDDFEL